MRSARRLRIVRKTGGCAPHSPLPGRIAMRNTPSHRTAVSADGRATTSPPTPRGGDRRPLARPKRRRPSHRLACAREADGVNGPRRRFPPRTPSSWANPRAERVQNRGGNRLDFTSAKGTPSLPFAYAPFWGASAGHSPCALCPLCRPPVKRWAQPSPALAGDPAPARPPLPPKRATGRTGPHRANRVAWRSSQIGQSLGQNRAGRPNLSPSV